MALVSVTLGDQLTSSNHPNILQRLSYFGTVTGEVRHFKFGGLPYHSMSQPVGDEPLLKEGVGRYHRKLYGLSNGTNGGDFE